MSINIMARNLAAMNAERMNGINSKKKGKVAEKLSSGYRINRAADDAAGLGISEGMRRMIRTLNQGTENAKNGISWVAIGDGSLNEAHDILHRMTELTIKSLNGTYSDADRALMQVEFKQLQSEIDRLTDETRYNEQHIFAEHEYPYYQFVGNVKWPQNANHVVTNGTNDLIISYQIDENSPVQEATITVPAGEYTTQELVDEIDTALEESGLKDQGLVLEYTKNGFCNLNIEGGISLDKVSGGLEYLIHDMYEGGSAGSLIGTTTFPTKTSTVSIFKDVNDELTFDIVNLDGTTKTINLTGANAIPEGTYTREDLIKHLNENTILKDTSVKAVEYGNCIKLESDDSIITRLKGNMFKVDYAEKKEQVATSVFYDNIGYSEAAPYAANLKGAAVLTTDNADMKHQYFHIDSSNNELIIQPNGSAAPITLTIADGEYTAERMSATLDQLFKDNGLGLELQAKNYYDVQTGRKGLEITSLKEGVGSKIGIDPKSSAYETLFTSRAYNQLEIKEAYNREGTDDNPARFVGGKDFSPLTGGVIANLPLTVIEGKNDKFVLEIDGVKRTVTLDAGQYDNTSNLTKAIKGAIDAAADELSDEKQKEAFKSVNVTLDSYSRICLTSDHRDVVSLTASSETGNTGFGDLFTTTTNYKHETATSKDGVAPLNTPISFPVKLNSGANTFRVTLDKHEFPVTVPAGTYDTEQKLLDAINNALPEAKTEQINKTFKTNTKYGSYKTYDTGAYGGTSGIVSSSKVNYSAVGKSNTVQGGGSDSQPLQNNAAFVTFSFSNNWPLKLDSSNNKLKININNQEKEVSLTAKEYATIDDLKTELQTQLNNEFTAGKDGVFGGVTVTKSGNDGLKLTANLMKNGVEQDAKFTNIECSTETSPFLKTINTKNQKASITIGLNLQDSFTINGNNNNFSFQYYTDGAWKTITVSIPSGTTKDNLAAQLNSTAGFKNNGITASISGNGRLVLTADTAKNGDRLRFNSDDCKTTGTNKSCVEAIFKNVDKEAKPPADLTIDDEDLGESANRKIEIESGKQKFTVRANNKTASFDLPTGTYDLSTASGRDKLQRAINDGLKANNMSEVTATINDNKLTLSNTETGPGAYTQMIYDGSDNSAMPAIFGTTPWEHQGVKAEFDADKKLKLTAVDKDGKTKTDSTISVPSQYGSIFQTAQPNGTSTVSARPYNGFHSKVHASIDGAPLLGNSVEITDWNHTLNLYYYVPGTSYNNPRSISIELQNDTYSFDDLQKELQDKLDEKAAGIFKADVTAKGVKISMAAPGSKYYFNETRNSGGFYYNVLRRAPEQQETLKEQVKDGGYDATVYAMGRQNVRQGKTITKDVNDVLTMDFTYGTNTKTISLTLTPGHYSGESLVRELQSKLNEQLKKEGFAENLIQVEIGVGGITLPKDLIGYNNDSLTFKLADNVELPSKDKVTYKIDGIGGNAAFSIFYQTDGDMRVAYVKGSKNVEKGVVVPEDSEFSLNVDGNPYTIKVDKGEYTAKEITEYLDKAFKDQNINVAAKIEGGNIQIVSTKYGKHPITNITGDARQYLFFEENGGNDGKGIGIRLSGVDGDNITIERPVMNTRSLGINSIGISKPKYGEKALTRLKAATKEVSGVRTMFGTMQNRLEHKVNSNNNAAENTQAAESLIRDADIAEEIMELSVNQILEQASQSMLTQANQSKALVLSLLQ